MKAIAILAVFSVSLILICCWGSQNKKKEPEKDLYSILELKKNVKQEDIKRQYRSMAKKYHPDKNPEYKDKYTEINEAYEILSDQKKRRIYDTRGYQAAKSADMQNDDDDGDIISNFFGGGGRRRQNKMEDQKIKLKVSLKDLYNGRELEFKFTRNVICPHCRGTGADSDDDIHVCDKCGGQGVTIERQQIAPGYVQQFQRACPKCGGKGKTIRKSCHVCQSSKIIPSLEDMSVYIEKGMKNDQEITFEDAGDESPDKNAGNLVFIINEGKDASFRRDNNDLHTSLDITLKEALLGFKKGIIHLDGREVTVTRNAVTQPGYVVKLQGEGMPLHQRSGEFGDLFVKLNVIFPLNLDENQRLMAEQLFARRSTW